MNPRPNLALVDDGEVPPDGPQSMAEALELLAEKDRRISDLVRTIGQLEEDLQTETGSKRAYKREVRKVQRELREKRKADTDADVVREVLHYWRDRCAPRAEISPGDDRWEKVVDRLGMTDRKSATRIDDRDGKGFTVEELKLTVDGALLSPWHCGQNDKGKKYLDAVSIFGDTTKVFKHVARAREHLEAEQDRRRAEWMAEHAPDMALALEQERQLGVLVGLEPTAFEPLPSELGGAA